MVILFFSLFCYPQKISPVQHIKNGFDTSSASDNVKNFIYKVHKRLPANNIHRLEESIKSLNKNIKLFKIYNFIQSGVRANLHKKDKRKSILQ